ncbi:hypothetical protein Q3G72_023715 [Acer saccharum]|nr:hypothetical protein Q3G72_023715 [Acer saccharum]
MIAPQFLPTPTSQFSFETNASTQTLSLLNRCSNMEELKQIHAQVFKKGYAFDDNTLPVRKLLAFCSSAPDSGSLAYAQKVFDGIDSPNTFMWNTIIRGYANSTQPEQALFLYRRMLADSVPQNAYTFPFLLKACSGLSSSPLEETKQIHAQVVKFGFGFDVFAANSLLHTYADSGVKPDNVALVSTISACAHLGALEQGRWIHTYIKRRGIKIDPILGSALVDMYAKCGDMEEAIEVFRRIKKKGKQIREMLIESDPDHSGRCILHLANIYGIAEEWDKTVEVRRQMTDQKVCKLQGCSSISLNGIFHEFVTGDSSHPEMDKINDMWNRISKRLKQEGYKPTTAIHQNSDKLAIAFGIIGTKPAANITESITILIRDDRYKIMFESNYGSLRRFVWRNCHEVEFIKVVIERWNTLPKFSMNAGDFLAIIEYFLGQDLPNSRIVFMENSLDASVPFSNDEMLPLTWSKIESFLDFLDITLNIGNVLEEDEDDVPEEDVDDPLEEDPDVIEDGNLECIVDPMLLKMEIPGASITESIIILIHDGQYQIMFERNYGSPKRFAWRNCHEVEFRKVVME